MTTCPECKYTTNDIYTICPSCGTIIDDSFIIKKPNTFQIDDLHNQDNPQNRPDVIKTCQLLVSIFVLTMIGSTMIYREINRSNQYKLEQVSNPTEPPKITQDSVKKVTVRLDHRNAKEVSLTKQIQDEFVKRVSKMTPVYTESKPRQGYARLIIMVIDAGDVGKYQLDIRSRSSLYGGAFAEFSNFGEDIKVNYDARELLDWLMSLPVIVQQNSSTGAFK